MTLRRQNHELTIHVCTGISVNLDSMIRDLDYISNCIDIERR